MVKDLIEKEENLYMGSSPKQDDFEEFWQDKANQASSSINYQMKKIDFVNPCAQYYELSCTATDGTALLARYIYPQHKRRVPTVIMFHDYDRGVRGWHRMTRFTALGYAVLALQNRSSFLDVTSGYETAPGGLNAVQLFTDALTAAYVALDLPRTDSNMLMTWGEGLGGGLAIAVASMVTCLRCAALNPLPIDYKKAWESGCNASMYAGVMHHFKNKDPIHQSEDKLFQALEYVDCVNFAPLLRGSLLLGTSLMDTTAPPDTQKTLFNMVGCEKRQILYPKYTHERINFFENELLKFLHV